MMYKINPSEFALDSSFVSIIRSKTALSRYFLTCLGPGVPYRRIKSFADYRWDVYSDENQNIQYADPSKQAQLMQKKSPRVEYTQVTIVNHYTCDTKSLYM